MAMIFHVDIPGNEKKALVPSTLIPGDWVLFVNDENNTKQYTFAQYGSEGGQNLTFSEYFAAGFGDSAHAVHAALVGRESGASAWIPEHILSQQENLHAPIVSTIADRIYVGQEDVIAGARTEGLESPLENWVLNYRQHQNTRSLRWQP